MKKNFYFLVAAFFLLTSGVFAQERICASAEYLEQQLQNNPGQAETLARLEAMTQERANNPQARSSATVLFVPVVVHVVYNNDEQNITDAQIQSQIDVINKDFRGTNVEFDAIQEIWPQAADMEIEFYLAQVDPDGNPTNGITRTETSIASFGFEDTMKSTAAGGKDPWDTSLYFNFWTVNFSGGLLGFAQFPGGAPDTDGIVMGYNFFGSSDDDDGSFTLSAPFDKGRTTTHEMGHFFNLRHIWGDGPCGQDDFVGDTPESDANNGGGCNVGHVSCGTVDMVENYMDYSDDACMGLFTEGQKNRMRATLEEGGPRAALVQSPFPFGIAVDAGSQSVDVCKPDDAVFNFTYTADDGNTNPVTFSAIDLPAGTTATFSPATASADETAVVMTLSGTGGAPVGTSDITLQATDGTDTVPAIVTLNLFDDTFGTIALGYPTAGSMGVPPMAEFTWSADDNAAAYEVDVATDGAFTNIVSQGVVTETIYVPMGLETNTDYWWRVRAVNNCGEGVYTTANFSTGVIDCSVTASSDTPIDIPDGIFFVGPGDPISSTIQVNEVTEITDINVTINVSHTWGDDLLITLTSPEGTEVVLTNRNGGNGTQYTNTVFDSDAMNPISGGNGNFTGTFTPDGDLSTLNGEIAAGDWLLTAQDFVSADTGTIDSWSIEVCGVPLPDADDDLIPDNLDNCPFTANNDQSDVDGDGQGDVCDDDIDGDGLLNADDNCPSTANADQEDLDENGIGDVCDVACTIATYTGEAVVIDDDSALPQQDYVITVDVEENFTITDVNLTVDIDHAWTGDLLIALFNPDLQPVIVANGAGGNGQNFTNTVFNDDAMTAIADGVAPFTGEFIPEESLSFFNGQQSISQDPANPAPNTWYLFVRDTFPASDGGLINGFSVEICGIRDSEDFDSDGILNDDDNCVITDNTDQADNDDDGEGDECDADDDNDGVLDVDDNCQFMANADQADNDGDGLGDICDDDDDNDGILDEDDNCQFVSNPGQEDFDQDGIGDVCDDISVNDLVTPNGDNINDTWIVQSIQLFPGTTVRVYDRSGGEVFSSNTYANDWAATGKNGKALPAGSYYYVVDQSGTGESISDGWLFVTY